MILVFLVPSVKHSRISLLLLQPHLLHLPQPHPLHWTAGTCWHSSPAWRQAVVVVGGWAGGWGLHWWWGCGLRSFSPYDLCCRRTGSRSRWGSGLWGSPREESLATRGECMHPGNMSSRTHHLNHAGKMCKLLLLCWKNLSRQKWLLYPWRQSK